MKTHQFDTKNYELEITFTIRCEKPCRIKLKGFDGTGKKNTVYFDTCYGKTDAPFRGIKKISIKMPLTPKVLWVNIYDELTNSDQGVTLLDTQFKRLTTKGLWYESEYTRRFLEFAKSFAEQAGYLEAGGRPYYAKGLGDRYIIKYSNSIKSRRTGKHEETPARIGSKTGVIEASAQHFRKYSIPVRMMILCHEWSHHILDTRSEFVADKKGLQMYLDMGFPDIEAMYAITKVFDNFAINSEKEKRAQEMSNMLIRR